MKNKRMIAVVFALVLTGCSALNKTQDSLPKTVEECRSRIAAVDSSEEKLEIYERLWALDGFEEQDYEALSDIYFDMGNEKMARQQLSILHTMYPSMEHLDMLNKLVMHMDYQSEIADLLVNNLQNDSDALYDLIISESWKDEFQDIFVGSDRKTVINGDGYIVQIESSKEETVVFMVKADGGCIYYRVNEGGAYYMTSKIENDLYNGETVVKWYDDKNDNYQTIEADISNNVCSGKVYFEVEGAKYTGTFSDEGSPKAEQQSSVTNKGGTVYAYNSGKTKYLFDSNTKKSEFIMNSKWLGMPEYTRWE